MFPENKTTSQRSKQRDFTYEWKGDAAYKNYALNICISRLANALSLCDFQTFLKKKEQQGIMWWRFNFEPNLNQNQTQFFHKIIYKMVFDCDGALVVQDNEGNFIVADDYTIEERAFKENLYSNIVVAGGYGMQSTKTESEVLHFVLHNNQVKSIVDGVYDDYGKLLAGTIRNYNRNNSFKFKLKMDSLFENFRTKNVVGADGEPLKREDGSIVTEYDDILEDFLENRYKGILEDKDSITPFEAGLDLDEIGNKKGNTKSGTATTRDITDTFTDIIHMCADAFGIPRAYIKGDVADGEVVKQNFIDDAVRPLADNFEGEINRKLYKFENVRAGTKMKIQTNTITTKDPVKFAAAAEALLRIGVYSPNMVLRKLGEEAIDEPWANEHFVTKNYQNMKEVEHAIKETVNAMLLSIQN